MFAAAEISFIGVSDAEASRLASSLTRSLKPINGVTQAEIIKTDKESMDTGAIISIVLAAPSVIMAVQAIKAWLARNNQAVIKIRTEAGSITMRGLESEDAPAAIRALSAVIKST